MKLRSHQQQLKELVQNHIKLKQMTGRWVKNSVTASVFPGGGKSLYPLIAGKELLEAGEIEHVLWLTPRKNLSTQAAQEAVDERNKKLVGHNFDFRESTNVDEVNPFRGHVGCVMSYQCLTGAHNKHKIDKSDTQLDTYLHEKRYLLVLDENHHIADKDQTSEKEEQGFYAATKLLVQNATYVIYMTGTCERHNNEIVAYIDYNDEVIGSKKKRHPIIDIRYEMKNGVDEKSIIPSQYTVISTKEINYKIDEQNVKKNHIENGRDLSVAVTTGIGNKLLTQGCNDWLLYRKEDPNAKLIVVCKDQKESRRALKYLEHNYGDQIGTGLLAICDERNAQNNIHRFRFNPDVRVLVTCQMAYEGMDCKDATHLIYLSVIKSRPWLIQVFTRIMRYNPKLDYASQMATVYIPHDEDLIDILNELGAKEKPITETVARIVHPTASHPQQMLPSIISDEYSIGGASYTSSQDGLHQITQEQKSQVRAFMAENNIHGEPLEIMKALRITGSTHLLKNYSHAIASQEELPLTPAQKEKELRDKLERLTKRMDKESGEPFGTWNKKVFNRFRFKQRSQMTMAELNQCYQWVVSEFNRLYRDQPVAV